MHRIAVCTFLSIFGLLLAGCSDSPTDSGDSEGSMDMQAGEYYWFMSADGDYKVLKVLAVETNLIHICYYNNVFKEQPTTDVIPSLYFGKRTTLGDDILVAGSRSATTTGRKHWALSLEVWNYWRTHFLSSGRVTPEELTAYEDWKTGVREVIDFECTPTN